MRDKSKDKNIVRNRGMGKRKECEKIEMMMRNIQEQIRRKES